MAHFEIHVLNFNGARHLPRCLEALSKLELGGHFAQLNLIDNGSSDDSALLVKRDFPNVRFIALGRNLGFSAGNNAAARICSKLALEKFGKAPDYHVFLNNDTEVHPEWLLHCAEVLEAEPDVGIVGSKALFMDQFVPLRIKISPSFSPSLLGSADTRELGAFLSTPLSGENIVPQADRMRTSGAYAQEQQGRWLAPLSHIAVPVIDSNLNSAINLSLRFAPHQGDQIRVEIFGARSTLPLSSTLCKGGYQSHFKLQFSPADYRRVIQNAGSFINQRWDAGDIGSGQADQGQFDLNREVSAICGVSMFIRHAVFEKLGGFDPRYFAYFEDTDLSVRAKLAGYRCKFVAKSRLLHLHAGSSGGEWSPTFSKLVSYSHFLFCSKFAPNDVWNERKLELQRSAFEQFEIYLRDSNLDNKPQLRTYLRYLKSPHVFLLNRYRRALRSVALNNYPFTAPDALAS